MLWKVKACHSSFRDVPPFNIDDFMAILDSEMLNWCFRLNSMKQEGGHHEKANSCRMPPRAPKSPLRSSAPSIQLVNWVLSKKSSPSADISQHEAEID